MYEYRCNACGTVSEILTGVSQEEPEIRCGKCSATDLKKLISVSNFNVARPKRQDRAPCGANVGEACDHCRHVG
jgi:putative FmdB family regulatory protein